MDLEERIQAKQRLRMIAQEERMLALREERKPEDQEFYRRAGTGATIGGLFSAVVAAGWIHIEAAKMALSNNETGVGGLLVCGSIAVAINVGNAFHSAAKYWNGPNSDAAHNLSKINFSNMFGYVVGATVGGLMCASALTQQENKRTEQTLWQMAPKMDPNTIIRQVTAAETYCRGERSGKLIQHDMNGMNHVFRCP